jgi:hypothetical protein
MALLLLQDFNPFDQIDGPSSHFSINDQEILWVFGIFPFAFLWSFISGVVCPFESDD